MLTEIRPVYKKLIKLAKSLPPEKSASALQEIRSEFRKNLHLTDTVEIAKALQRAQSSIGYMKIVTPRKSADAGVQKFIYKNGMRMEGNSQMDDNATYKNPDFNEGLKRHYQLMRRQYFMDRK